MGSYRFFFRLAFLIGLSITMVASVNADVVEFVFAGTLPSGASNHSHVVDGESFTASFLVDTSFQDSLLDNEMIRSYEGAALVGELIFSGGFESQLDLSGIDVRVFNDFELVANFTPLDAVQVQIDPLDPRDFRVQATTSDNNSLMSDELPLPGTTFVSAADSTFGRLSQLTYSDEFGSIEYNTLDDANVSFSAIAVPEPTFWPSLFAVSVVLTNIRRSSAIGI